MENVLQKIASSEVKKRYPTEKDYYENVLSITQQSWNRWKRGDRGFSEDNLSIIKDLFTDYEWMLVGKIVSELESNNASETVDPYGLYLKSKLTIAKEWLNQDVNIELDEFDQPIEQIQAQITFKQDWKIDLENSSDLITFDLRKTKGKVKSKKKKQKKWLKKNQKFIL